LKFFQGNQYKRIFTKELGPLCDAIYGEALAYEIKRAMQFSNVTFEFGTCPIEPTAILLNNYTPEGNTDYLPPYLPGNFNLKKVNFKFFKNF
jgi:hypothetical protein